jgi:DNA polymerase-3 subunit alpha/error-prone DNA polymerase
MATSTNSVYTTPDSVPAPRAAPLERAASPPDFVELLARSCFSFLQCASRPEEMVARAQDLGYRGLALCDVNGLYGVVRGFEAAERPSAFATNALAAGSEARARAAARGPFHYMVGAELTLYDASPVALLPLNKDGYARLSRLIAAAKRPAPKGYIALSLRKILEESEDLLALPLPPWKEDDLRRLQDAFQDRAYLPVYKDLTWSAVELYQQALRIERDLRIPAFATQRPLYHVPERKPLLDVLTCILHGTTLDEAGVRLAPNRERALKPLPELAALWRERPDMLRRTIEIADRVSFSLTELRYRYPQEALRRPAVPASPPPAVPASPPPAAPAGTPPAPPAEALPGGAPPEAFLATPAEFLRELVEEGLARRYPATDASAAATAAAARKQVERELALIRELEYEDYFLTIWDICAFARDRGILHQGRGSAANSVVCFALGITSVDPIALNLLFERFISRERGEPPDIDVDFEHERREEVIQYIFTKYGAQNAAMVCTTICYRSRMAVRDVAKALGFPPAEIDALVRRMGREGLRRLLEEESAGPQAAASSAAKLRLLLRFASEIQGFPRHLGIHSGGFVIARDPITEIVPVEKAAMDGRYVIQWNKDDVNALGLMKIDILSLGMLTALRKAFALLKAHKGLDLDLASLPAGDSATYDSACAADTVGVFQIESRAQMSLLPRLKPRCYYDLVVEVAIVRPGPIQGGMVHPYLRRREGREEVVYAHPSLRTILQKTLGVPLFQEQIMQIAMAVAGFTPGEADELRRIMSSHWTKPNIMDGLRQRLLGGMLSHGIKPEFAEQIYKTIQGFSSYGFPESHAASFALLTYASLYLKRHHPEAFACALLNSQPMGFYSVRALIADAQRHGVAFLPLDATQSNWDYQLQPAAQEFSTKSVAAAHAAGLESPIGKPGKLAVRAGFRAIHGLAQKPVDKLVHERQAGGPFQGFEDFVRRAQLPRSALLKLAAAGALAALVPRQPNGAGHGDGRLAAAEALWAIQGTSLDPQSLFFGRAAHKEDSVIFPSESEWQALLREYHSHGYSLYAHPLSVLRPRLARARPTFSTARQLATRQNRVRVRVAGLLAMMQKPPTAKGICFLSLEDETGLFNAVLTPDVYEACRGTIMNYSLLDIGGLVECRAGARNIRVESLRPLQQPP